MNAPQLLCGTLALALAVAGPAKADAIIDLNLIQQNAKAPSAEPLKLLVHNGMALLGTPAQATGQQLRFDQSQNIFHLIDHRHRTVMAMDEAAVIQFTDQTQQMLAMARGFAEQLALLPPKQRAKLESMIGDGPLAQLARRPPPAPAKQTLRLAGGKTVGGVSCQRLEVLGNGNKLAEICLAKAGAIPLAEPDYATLEAMRQLAQRLAERAAPLAQQIGLPLPALNDAKLAGLPVEMKNLTGDKRETITLTQITTEPVAEQSLSIPPDYKNKPLTAWKF